MNIEKLIRDEYRDHSMYEIELKETIEYKGLINNKPEIVLPTRPIEIVVEPEQQSSDKPHNYLLEQFIDINDRTKSEIGKTVKEMIGNSSIIPLGKYLKSLNQSHPELKDASIDVKCDKIRNILSNRNAYNSIMITSIYKSQKSLVNLMTEDSIIVTVDFSSEQKLRYFQKEEYLDFIDCGGVTVERLMEFVPHDDSELDKKLSRYEELSKYMDLEPLYLRDESRANPEVFAQFKSGYSFYTYAGNEGESRWVEAEEGSRKNLIARSKSQYTPEEVNQHFEFVEAVLQFIEDNPEEQDLFDDLDIIINPATGKKERLRRDILDINPDWIGQLRTPETELELMEMAELMVKAAEHNNKILDDGGLTFDEAIDFIRDYTGTDLVISYDYDDYDEE